MSYILEALKKSEKKRQGEQNNLSHLATQEPSGQEPEPSRRAIWPLLLGIALVINAGVLLYIFWPSHPQIPSAPEKPATQHTSLKNPGAKETEQKPGTISNGVPEQQLRITRAVAPESTSVQSQARPDASAAPATQQIRQPQATSTIETRSKVDQDIDTAQLQPGDEQHQAPQILKQAALAQETTVQASPQVTPFNELPLSYRGQLPDMHMSVHVYSGSPYTGLIRINENMLRPGDYFDNRLLLEEITAKGAVFSYQGQWFLLPRRH